MECVLQFDLLHFWYSCLFFSLSHNLLISSLLSVKPPFAEISPSSSGSSSPGERHRGKEEEVWHSVCSDVTDFTAKVVHDSMSVRNLISFTLYDSKSSLTFLSLGVNLIRIHSSIGRFSPFIFSDFPASSFLWFWFLPPLLVVFLFFVPLFPFFGFPLIALNETQGKSFCESDHDVEIFLIQSSCLFILFFLPLFSYWCLHAFTGTERTTHLSLKTGEGVTHEEKNRMTEQKEEEEEEDREKLTHKRKSALFCFWGLFLSFISLCFILLHSPSYLPFTPLFVSLFSLWLISSFSSLIPFLVMWVTQRSEKKQWFNPFRHQTTLSLSPSHLMLLSASSEGSERKRESTETQSPREKDIDSIERHGKHFSRQQKTKHTARHEATK